jgi:hypothetical protein
METWYFVCSEIDLEKLKIVAKLDGKQPATFCHRVEKMLEILLALSAPLIGASLWHNL